MLKKQNTQPTTHAHTPHTHKQTYTHTHTHKHTILSICIVGKLKIYDRLIFNHSAKLDPMRPSRKFSQPKGSDEEEYDAMKDKQAARQARLAALAEETFNDEEWTKRKSDLASKVADDA